MFLCNCKTGAADISLFWLFLRLAATVASIVASHSPTVGPFRDSYPYIPKSDHLGEARAVPLDHVARYPPFPSVYIHTYRSIIRPFSATRRELPSPQFQFHHTLHRVIGARINPSLDPTGRGQTDTPTSLPQLPTGPPTRLPQLPTDTSVSLPASSAQAGTVKSLKPPPPLRPYSRSKIWPIREGQILIHKGSSTRLQQPSSVHQHPVSRSISSQSNNNKPRLQI